MRLNKTIAVSILILVFLINNDFLLSQSITPISKEYMRLTAIHIAEIATRYDIMIHEIDKYSSIDWKDKIDSADFDKRYQFLTYDSIFSMNSRATSRYQTSKHGFEYFEVETFPRGFIGKVYTYNIAVGYDGGVYRFGGFSKSDFQNLIKHTFKKVNNIEDAKLIAKWYFGFQDINLAFHEKVIPAKLNKNIMKYLKQLKVTIEEDNYILTDYTTTFYSEYASLNFEERRFNADVYIEKYIVKINKNTCRISVKEERVKTIKLKNVTSEEFQITYLF